MGIAIISGVIASLEQLERPKELYKWESHTPGTLSPTGLPDASIPTRFIACVSRRNSAIKLSHVFGGFEAVSVLVSKNLEAVQQSEVVLLWYVSSRVPVQPCPYASYLSCKPQLAHSILSEPGIKDALEGKLLISILAGVTISQLTTWVLPSTRVIRAMPNTPCKVCNFPPSN
jgi:pyrroline-5-carboxylate reductase